MILLIGKEDKTNVNNTNSNTNINNNSKINTKKIKRNYRKIKQKKEISWLVLVYFSTSAAMTISVIEVVVNVAGRSAKC